ncbi:hypothetical protein QBC46DRAFT_401599, partial [Diplogelasinospora grovesii]
FFPSIIIAFHSAFVLTHSLLLQWIPQWILHTWKRRTCPVLSNSYQARVADVFCLQIWCGATSWRRRLIGWRFRL